MVITSRPYEYDGSPGPALQLSYTAVVELQPVDVEAAGQYLLEGQIGAARKAWQDVADHLLAQPNGVLAQTMNTPLTLSLARSAYAGGDPRALLASELTDEKALRGELIDQVLITAYPNVKERHRVTYWLGWLANNMSTRSAGITRDLCWWEIPDSIDAWRIILAAGGVGGLVGWVVMGLLFGLPKGLSGLASALFFGFSMAILVGGFTAHRLENAAKGTPVHPHTVSIRWPTRRELSVRRFSEVLVMGHVYGILLWLLLGLRSLDRRKPAGLVVWIMIGLFVALIFRIASMLWGLWRQILLASSPDVTPRTAYQRDMRSHAVMGILAGVLAFTVGLGWTVIFGAALHGEDRLRSGLLFGVMVGLAVGLAVALVGDAASLLFFTELALFMRARPVRFMLLLETPLDRQVLRQAGAVYQFRHADLQDRLAERYEAGLTGAETNSPPKSTAPFRPT
jgi:hypothetical protein